MSMAAGTASIGRPVATSGVELEDGNGPPVVGVRVTSIDAGTGGTSIVSGIPITVVEPMRQLSRQLTSTTELTNSMRRARADPGTADRAARVIAIVCTLVCILGIGMGPAIWCLSLYATYGGEPCDRPIAYNLLWIGVASMINAVLATFKACIRVLFCPKPSANAQTAGEEDSSAGKAFDSLIQCLNFVPQMGSFVQWMWLSGTCFWMYPYSDEVVSQLDSGNLTIGHNGTIIGFWPGAIPWTIQNDPNLLNHGIEGCHPGLLFGARGYLIFTYVMVGCLCTFLPVCLCCVGCATAARDANA